MGHVAADVSAGRKLERAFYARATLQVARELIGMHLIRRRGRERCAVRIVETEAYQGPNDLAAHSARGLTPRTLVMFGPAGHAYVYLIYGFWHCLNIVTRTTGVPHAVLIRAAEPLENVHAKTWGPGLLCRALDIDRSLNGTDLTGDALWLESPAQPLKRRPRIVRGPRIGVDYAGDWAAKPWRFYERDSPYVSTVRAAQRTRLLKGVP
jgi:DNA-3-methyladenine glycosylase